MKAKKRWILLCAVVLCVLALGGAGLLRGMHLLHTALDGRRTRPQEDTRMTDGLLRAQMVRSQMDTRTQGWLTVIPTEEIAMNTQRGKLYAWLFAPLYKDKDEDEDEDAPWALVLHGGLGTDHMDVLDVACALSMEGYRVLAPDLYAHGKSEGSCASLGLSEAEDVRAWIQWMLEREPDAGIVIWAQDEGAAAALAAAGGGLPQAVRAIAADSAYASIQGRAHELLAEVADGPASKNRLDKILMDAAYCLMHGASVRDGELTDMLRKVDMPLLLLHGTGDQDVPAWHSEDLAAAAGEKASLFFAEGALHGMARHAQPQAYYDVLLDFYEAALAAQEE